MYDFINTSIVIANNMYISGWALHGEPESFFIKTNRTNHEAVGLYLDKQVELYSPEQYVGEKTMPMTPI